MSSTQQPPPPGFIDNDPLNVPRSFGSQIALKRLSRFCHNVGQGLHAGIDVLKIFENESRTGSPRHQAKVGEIRERIGRGETIASSLSASGGYFPSLLCEMAEVGERTGRLEQVFLRLGEHYDNMLKMRRMFLGAIALPVAQLLFAFVVIGVFILIVGAIADPPPITFFGLYGTRGFAIYCGILGTLAAIAATLFCAAHFRLLDPDPFMRLMINVPLVGRAFKTIAIARLTWALALSTDSDIDAGRACELAVKTTNNSYFTSHVDGIKNMLGRGRTMHDAFVTAGVFPDDFLDALQAGELSGQISESMARLAVDYEERSKGVFKAITAVASACALLLFIGLMIAMIMSLAMQYVGILNDAAGI